MASQKRIPTGKAARGGVVGIAAARVGVKKAGQLVSRPFLSEARREQAALSTDQDIAVIIFNALSRLRGTALKAAQLIAMEMDMVPEVLRQELSKASSQVPPMNRALVRKIIRTELGPPEQVFSRFDPIPFAAASLGQVHAAAAEDGIPLAVKVQYPGMAEGVASDIALLRGVLTPTRYGRIFRDCFDEISRKVGEELDYRREAENTRDFSGLPNLDGYCFPEVVSRYSTATVLTTTRVEGRHPGAWLETSPSRAARDHFGQLLVDLFHRSTYDLGCIHADPNPGNYLFREDGRLGVIDFGCVKRLDEPLIRAVRAITSPDLRLDRSSLEQLLEGMGIYYREAEDPDAFAAFLAEWIDWIREPYRCERFDFSAAGDYFKRGAALGEKVAKYLERYDGSFIYYGRTWHGVLRLLEQLGATVSMRHS